MLTAANAQLGVCLSLAQAISTSRTVGDIYETALDALARALNVSRSSILLFDEDGVMRFKASRLISERYRSAVEGHSPWTPDTRDPGPIVVADIRQEPSLADYLPAIEAEGIAAMAFIPLVSLDRVIGKFMLYFDEPRTLGSDELQIAGLIASHVAFAVERTRAEEQARRNEERLRFALDAANMGTWDWELGTQSLRWSDNLERIHGLPDGTFDSTFDSYEREIHPEDRERVLGSIKRALSEGVPHHVEYRIVAPDGTVRWVEGKGRVERGPGGEPVRMSGVCMDVTPRKTAEHARMEAVEASHRASERLAAIVESSGDSIVSKTLDGTITSWNRTAERMFGYAAGEVIGRSIVIIIPPDRRDEEQAVLARIQAGEQVEIETVRQHRDGTRIPVSLMVSPVRDTGGRIVGASKVARDITARKRDEAERAELHRRLGMLVQASASLLHSPDMGSVVAATISLAQQLLVADGYAVWMHDPEQRTWRVARSAGVSERFANRLVALDAAAAQPDMPWSGPLAVTDVAEQPMLLHRLAAYRQEGIESLLACPMRPGRETAGTLVFYYRTRRRFTDLDLETGQTLANLSAAAITTADLYEELRTERNAAEAARRRAAFLADATAILARSLDYEQTFPAVARLAVAEIADWCAVNIVDQHGVLQPVAVAHVDPARVEKARILQLRYPADPDVAGSIHHVVRTGTPAMMSSITREMIAAYATDGEHRRLLEEIGLTSYMCLPLSSASGTLGAITLAYADSGRRYTDHDLAFAQELAARAALAVENAIAYRRVNEASRLKDEFLATLSHELRTPLNAILGYSQMLSMGALSGERRSNAITVLLRNAESLKQIIEDVLDVSRITSGKLRLNARPLDLRPILANAAATVQPAAEAKGVRIDASIDTIVPPVLGDADRLQQVAWNLLSNAVKFTPRGGQVALRLEEVSSSVQVVVSDNGQGIQPAFLPHLFQRFRQADSRFSREHGGLGLGLALVRELTELHGGVVSAASEGPGKGATFTVKLPAMTTPAQALVGDAERQRRLPSTVPDQHMPDRLSGLRILAVDNEEDARGLLRITLESAGAQVVTAPSGPEALDLLRNATFDVLIADIGMPQMDGLELMSRIRNTLPAPAKNIPAAALTAYTRGVDRSAALSNGFQMHLSKPFHPTELVIAIAALIGR